MYFLSIVLKNHVIGKSKTPPEDMETCNVDSRGFWRYYNREILSPRPI